MTEALLLSLRLSAVTTAVLLVIGLPVAYWLAFSPRRWKIAVEAFVALPLVLPPTVLGFYILVAVGPFSPLGRSVEELTGHRLAFTFEGLVLGSVLFSLPFAVQPFTAAFRAVDRRLIEASWSLGESKAMTFARVILPLSFGGVIAGAILSFAHTLGEFGVALMVGGNIPGVTRTASIAIYEEVQALEYRAAAIMSLLLLVVSYIVLVLTQLLQHRKALHLWPESS